MLPRSFDETSEVLSIGPCRLRLLGRRWPPLAGASVHMGEMRERKYRGMFAMVESKNESSANE